MVGFSIVNEGHHFQGIALGPGSGQGKGPEDPARIDEWYREGKLSYYERQERIICRAEAGPAPIVCMRQNLTEQNQAVTHKKRVRTPKLPEEADSIVARHLPKDQKDL